MSINREICQMFINELDLSNSWESIKMYSNELKNISCISQPTFNLFTPDYMDDFYSDYLNYIVTDKSNHYIGQIQFEHIDTETLRVDMSHKLKGKIDNFYAKIFKFILQTHKTILSSHEISSYAISSYDKLDKDIFLVQLLNNGIIESFSKEKMYKMKYISAQIQVTLKG